MQSENRKLLPVVNVHTHAGWRETSLTMKGYFFPLLSTGISLKVRAQGY